MEDVGALTTGNLSGKKIFIIGDSHADAYKPMVQRVSARLGIDYHIYSKAGCHVLGLKAPMREDSFCKDFIEESFDKIGELASPGDVIFFAALRIPRLADLWQAFDEVAVISQLSSSEAVIIRENALEEASKLIEMFNAKGLHVLIDTPKPVYQSIPFRCSDWFNNMNPICSAGFTMGRSFLIEYRKPIMDSIEILKNRYHQLAVWDPFSVLCKDTLCSAFDGDKPLFFDGDHISGYGNRVLVPSFQEKLLEIVGK